MQPITWIKEKYTDLLAQKDLGATIVKYCKDMVEEGKKMLFRAKHLEAANEDLAYYHFARGNINDAILRFNIIKKFNPRPVYDFFLGRLYWEKGKPAKSLECLNQYLSSGNKEFELEANYCKSLASFNTTIIGEVPIFFIQHNFQEFFYMFERRFIAAQTMPSASLFFNALEPTIIDRFKEKAIHVLDLGCSDGVLGECFKKKLSCNQIDGYELVSNLATLAKNRKLEGFQVYTEIHNVNFYSVINTIEAKYDVILAENFFCYSRDLSNALKEIVPCLQKNGVLAFSLYETTAAECEFSPSLENFAFNAQYVHSICEKNKLQVLVTKEIKYSVNSTAILYIVTNGTK